jgi:hypothetical protein
MNIKQQIAQHISTFRTHTELTELRQAANLIDSIPVHSVLSFPERRAARATKLALWLTLLDTFDSAKDPHFDPAARLSAQGDGDQINRYRLQKELRQLDAELSLRADLYIANAFLKSPKTAGEMNEAIGRYTHYLDRANHLLSLVTPPK